MRVPTIFWLPGIISPGIINQIGSTMDLLTTFSKIVGVPIPEDRQLDSYDLGPRLFENNPTSRTTFFITEEMNYMLSDLVNIKPII